MKKIYYFRADEKDVEVFKRFAKDKMLKATDYLGKLFAEWVKQNVPQEYLKENKNK